LVGLLPKLERLDALTEDKSADKRARYIDDLLADDVAYAEHWLTFWNDLLRNDYDGTGFITGGRKQISGWLYESLLNNKAYDQFVRELIAPPSDESRGFIDGIKWRGEVSAGQTVEIQFAQSVSQSLLGINMKCASCHDSFIDRWKLDEAYGLAAIYANEPLQIHRCDKPVGRTATAAWLFPELGSIDATAPPAERLKQLAGLMTHPQNGRFTRTIVNRLWHRMLGRGIVHPTDAMQTEPWSSDLLDYLASDFAQHGYDLKHTLRLIATSAAYQSRSEVLRAEESAGGYQYAGPRAKRMTAEQFIDTVWQLTETAPTKMDAKLKGMRGKVDPALAKSMRLSAQWIWSSDQTTPAPAGQQRTFRKQFVLPVAAEQAGAVVSCDNRFTLFVNGRKLANSDNWQAPVAVSIGPLPAGPNEVMIVAANLGDSPNPAGLLFQASIGNDDSPRTTLTSDATWQWSSEIPGNEGKFAKAKTPDDWQAAVAVMNQKIWDSITGDLQTGLARAAFIPQPMMRASLLKSDPLMRSLGRPNRDQIVTMRPNDLSTLEAIDLANGVQLAKLLSDGADHLLKRSWDSPPAMVNWLYRAALSRDPTDQERIIALELLGDPLSQRGIEDLLWAVIMLPEYQLIR